MDLGPTQNMFDIKQNHCHLTLDPPPSYMKHLITFTAKLCAQLQRCYEQWSKNILFLKNASMYETTINPPPPTKPILSSIKQHGAQ